MDRPRKRQARSLARWIEFAGGKRAATGNILSPRQVCAHRALCPDTHRPFEPGSEIRRSSSGRLVGNHCTETGAAHGARRMARSLPALLVKARRCPGATPGQDGEGALCERKEET